MYKAKSLAVIVSALMLQACVGGNTKPENQAAPAPIVETEKKQPPLMDTPPPGTAVAMPQISNAGPVSSADFERLEGRFNLAQEQLLGLITRSAQLQEQNHRMMMMMQSIQSRLGQANTVDPQNQQQMDADNDFYDTGALDMLLEQLLAVANDLGAGSLAGEFRVASVYTRSGDWVLVRFNRVTGETWLADAENWVSLSDDEVLPASEYAVNLVRAENDTKGYSAVRVDRNNGKIWWLRQQSWQPYGQ